MRGRGSGAARARRWGGALFAGALLACGGGQGGGPAAPDAAEEPPAARRPPAGAAAPIERADALQTPLDALAGTRELVDLGESPLAAAIQAAQDARDEPAYLPPTAAELRRFEEIVTALGRAALLATQLEGPESARTTVLGLPLSFERAERLCYAASLLGFELAVGGGGDWLLLRELEGVRRGGGVYALRTRLPHPEAPLVLQAPHAFYDVRTGEIALGLFEGVPADALMLNTVHRYRGALGGSADLAHLEESYFQAATRGLAAALAGARVVQLHGYSPERHPELGEAQLVASKGSAARIRDPVFDVLVQQLRAALGEKAVVVYGVEVRKLGGTTNAQGRYLNAYTDDLFYHLELAHGLRTRLAQEPPLAGAFAAAFRRALTPAPAEPAPAPAPGPAER